MTGPTPTEQIIAEKTVCMLLVRGENPEGGPIYAYVAVRADRLEEFLKAQESGVFYPDEYGMIVEAGEGEPDAEVRQRMEQEYGFNHAGMMDIPSSVSSEELNQNIRDMRAQQAELDAGEMPTDEQKPDEAP